MAGARHALTLRSKGQRSQGYKVCCWCGYDCLGFKFSRQLAVISTCIPRPTVHFITTWPGSFDLFTWGSVYAMQLPCTV